MYKTEGAGCSFQLYSLSLWTTPVGTTGNGALSDGLGIGVKKMERDINRM
jgi:hypothetical protein